MSDTHIVNLLHSLTFNHVQWKVYCKKMFVSETGLELILLIFACSQLMRMTAIGVVGR